MVTRVGEVTRFIRFVQCSYTEVEGEKEEENPPPILSLFKITYLQGHLKQKHGKVKQKPDTPQ